MKVNDKPVVVTAVYNCTVYQMWNAITDLDKMTKWYFSKIPDFKPILGFETKFIVNSGERVFTHNWKITQVENQKLIKYNWTFDEYKGESYSNFVIKKINESNTQLTLTCGILTDFTADIIEFNRESCLDGWNYFLNDKLKKYLQNEI